jgi:hypothetical protein
MNRTIMSGLAEDPGVGWYRRLQVLNPLLRDEEPVIESQMPPVYMRGTVVLKGTGYSTMANKN